MPAVLTFAPQHSPSSVASASMSSSMASLTQSTWSPVSDHASGDEVEVIGGAGTTVASRAWHGGDTHVSPIHGRIASSTQSTFWGLVVKLLLLLSSLTL